MARSSTINVSLTPKQLRLVRQRVAQGGYESASEVVRDSLRRMFSDNGSGETRPVAGRAKSTSLAAGYKAMASHDRKLAREWSNLQDVWPDA